MGGTAHEHKGCVKIHTDVLTFTQEIYILPYTLLGGGGGGGVPITLVQWQI